MSPRVVKTSVAEQLALFGVAPRMQMTESIRLTLDSLGVYGGDEAEELHARTGCVGCPLATVDTALDALLAKPAWAYLAPLKRLRPLWRELRLPRHRLRKPGGERRQDGTLVANQHRMGPIALESRLWALGEVLAIQAEVNAAAQGRPPVDILNAEEEARVRELVAARTWPQRWTGDEPRADAPFDDGDGQGALFEDDEWVAEAREVGGDGVEVGAGASPDVALADVVARIEARRLGLEEP